MTILSRAAAGGALALALALAACSKADAPADGASDAPAAAATASSGDEDLRDISSFELTMPRIEKYFQSMRNLALATKDMSPEERDRLDMDASDASLDEYVRKLESDPVIRKAIDDADSTPREFALTMMASLQAGMAAAVIDMRPNDDADSLAREMKASMKNIKFMREHRAEMEARQKELEAELKRLGVDTSDDEGE
jgi:hypothetical protein